MNQHVFVNRILNMKKIKYIGLDMDHTLIRYHARRFEALVFKLVIEQLIKDKHYPALIKQLGFHFDDAIRGLVIDSQQGNILKLSRYGAIRQSAHGTKPIDFAEQKKIYRSTYVDLGDPNYMVIDTSFSIAFCVLYAQLVDLKDEYPKDFPNYATLAKDVLSAVDNVHAEGFLKKQISEHLDHYVIREPEVVEGLKRCLQHGKKIFILTNSEYYYTNLLLNHAINPFLENGQTWHSLFEYVGSVDNSSSEALRPAACPRDPEILLNAQTSCAEIDRTGSRGQAAGRRDLNCQQTLTLLPASKKKSELQRWALQLENVYSDRLLNITSEVVHIWGELTAQAKLKGVTIPTSDGLIAATALAHGLHVMTRNVANFQSTGVLLLNPWE
jgi:FMN phosphatase YigB (HAD superfamily)